jgi:transcriptional regulator with PAS, ATPase and Fis domain
VAQSVHNASRRARGPFVAINCAALPRELFEAELFGYKEGAFSPAGKNGRIGKMELADGGTLVLDEISLMPLELQAKLLRVLEDGIITRLGDATPVRVDLRIVAATNDNLLDMSNRGSFRKDLYFRLSVAEIGLPPLRERAADIQELSNFILSRVCRKLGRNRVALSGGARECLACYPWPGNIRELENVLEVSALLASDGIIRADNLPRRLAETRVETCGSAITMPATAHLAERLSDIETDVIRDALCKHAGNISKAAKVLGISRSTIYRKMRKVGAERQSEHQPTDQLV